MSQYFIEDAVKTTWQVKCATTFRSNETEFLLRRPERFTRE